MPISKRILVITNKDSRKARWVAASWGEENAHQGWTQNSLTPIRLSIDIPKQTQNDFIAKDYICNPCIKSSPRNNIQESFHLKVWALCQLSPPWSSYFPNGTLWPKSIGSTGFCSCVARALEVPWTCKTGRCWIRNKQAPRLSTVSTPFSSWNQPIWEGVSEILKSYNAGQITSGEINLILTHVGLNAGLFRFFSFGNWWQHKSGVPNTICKAN